jgi:GNAT superfamily N-acetyltransferase
MARTFTRSVPLSRAATPADAAEVVRVTNTAYVVESFFIDGTRTDEDEVRRLIAQPQSSFLVVDDPETPDRLRASVYVEIDGSAGYFAMLAVDPPHQGKGLARLLIQVVEGHCRAAGCTRLDFDMINLRHELPAFYARFGFVQVGTAEMGDRHKLKQECYRIKMSKALLPSSSAR